jgi:hypothetical protein
MIVDYLDLVDIALVPNKADSPALIDSDTILAMSVSLESFQAVSRRSAQIIEGFRPVKHAQFAQGGSLNFCRQFSRWFPVKEPLCVFIPEIFYHEYNL